jgi:hypothetical protein
VSCNVASSGRLARHSIAPSGRASVSGAVASGRWYTVGGTKRGRNRRPATATLRGNWVIHANSFKVQLTTDSQLLGRWLPQLPGEVGHVEPHTEGRRHGLDIDISMSSCFNDRTAKSAQR